MLRPDDPNIPLQTRAKRTSTAVLFVMSIKFVIFIIVFGVVLGYVFPRGTRLRELDTEINTMHFSMLDRETGIRGYVASGRHIFLEPYWRGQSEAQRVIPKMRADMLAYFRPNSREFQTYQRLVQTSSLWQQNWANAALARTFPASDNETVAFLGEGKKYMDTYRLEHDHLQTMVADQVQRNTRIGTYSLIAAAVLVLVGTLLATFIFWICFERAVVLPVGEILRRINAVSQADLTIHPNIRGSNEFTEISTSLNAMIVMLAKRRCENANYEAQLVEARRSAESANTAKSAFLSHMSHEIRTPMNAIIGLTNIVLDSPLNKEQKENLEIVRNSGDMLLCIINDILDYSKIETGKIILEEKVYCLPDVLESVIDLLRQQSYSKALELVADFDVELPRFVTGDKNRLRQILVNLVSNAIKFTDHGHVILGVHFAGAAQPVSSQGKVMLEFEVADTGIGMSPQIMSKIFNSFQQGDPSIARRYGGTGLGLVISQHLVNAMGGKIAVESQEDKGSRFHFIVAMTVAAAGVDVQEANSISVLLAGKSALIIDDLPVNRKILRRMLENWGMKCVSESNGENAIRRIQNHERFDVALIDYNIPRYMNGLEVAETFRQFPESRNMPNVLLTSVAPENIDVSPAISQCVMKPLKASILRDVLSNVLGTVGQTPAVRHEPVVIPQRDFSFLKVLLAEDNAENQFVAKKLLAKFKVTPDVVPDGAQAVAAVRKKDYDLVFMDVQMPITSGLEATRIIRHDLPPDKQPWITAMTASALPEDREQCLESGMNGYISKPIITRELIAALERVPVRSAASKQIQTKNPSAIDQTGK